MTSTTKERRYCAACEMNSEGLKHTYVAGCCEAHGGNQGARDVDDGEKPHRRRRLWDDRSIAGIYSPSVPCGYVSAEGGRETNSDTAPCDWCNSLARWHTQNTPRNELLGGALSSYAPALWICPQAKHNHLSTLRLGLNRITDRVLPTPRPRCLVGSSTQSCR